MLNKKLLEKLYGKYSKRELVYPDPVGFLYDNEELQDREIVGLIASSLAYGRVAQINKSVSSVLEKMKPSPYAFITKSNKSKLDSSFQGFKHRFTTGEELSYLLYAIKIIIEESGSLQSCFLSGLKNDDENVFSALSKFSEELMKHSEVSKNSLIPLPGKGSACKRQNLYLRWMVRKDIIDPGGWEKVPTSKLIMPTDIHIHKFGLKLNLTGRKNADMKTAIEITNAFKKVTPEDPVKYDFCLQRSSLFNDEELNRLCKCNRSYHM